MNKTEIARAVAGLVLCCTMLVGCAGGLVPMGKDTFYIEHRGSSWSTVSSLKAKCLRDANAYCEKKGLVMVPVATTGHDGGFGVVGSCELTFRALPPGDPEIKRPNVENHVEYRAVPYYHPTNPQSSGAMPAHAAPAVSGTFNYQEALKDATAPLRALSQQAVENRQQERTVQNMELQSQLVIAQNATRIAQESQARQQEEAQRQAATLQTNGVQKFVYHTPSNGHWIKQNIDTGKMILLEDGSLWQIDPLDKIDSTLWLTLDSITITDSHNGSIGYDYLLVNSDDRHSCHAKLLTK